MQSSFKPTKAFRIASIAALIVGVGAYFIGLYNAPMALNEKGYYFTIMLFGLFSVISLQKTVRDNMEGVPSTKAYLVASGVAVVSAIALLAIGLVNAELLLSEKGFFAMAFTLSLFAAITVQKNVRDSAAFESCDHKNTDSSKRSEHVVEVTTPKAKA
ncbi:inner membrane protein YiaA [Alteromonas gracilis]|uniref:inner membrane protein YiaA n=1 Tax=Alteromonas gracilis TaxID=1479524 RepID=UPI00321A138F